MTLPTFNMGNNTSAFNWMNPVDQQPSNYLDTSPSYADMSMPGYSSMTDYGIPAQAAQASAFKPGYDGNLFSGFPAASSTGSGNGMFGGLFDNFLGSKDANGVASQGWGGAAIGIGTGLMNGFMGMKQYGLAKDALQASKDQFNLNYNAQKKTTNASLEDRQRARVASNAGAYQSVGDYMSQNGIK